VTEYAIRVKFDDEWMMVSEIVECMDYFKPVIKTFDTREAAQEHAEIFTVKGKEENVEVVEYDPES